MELEDKKLPINPKSIAKSFEIYGFCIVGYYIRSESRFMIALQAQAYYVPGSQNDLCVVSPQDIHKSEE